MTIFTMPSFIMPSPRALRMEAHFEEIDSDARCKLYCQESSDLTRMSWRGMPLKLGEVSNGFTYLHHIFGQYHITSPDTLVCVLNFLQNLLLVNSLKYTL